MSLQLQDLNALGMKTAPLHLHASHKNVKILALNMHVASMQIARLRGTDQFAFVCLV